MSKELKIIGVEQPPEMEHFYNMCNWAYTCWQMKKYLYDENQNDQLMKTCDFVHFFNDLNDILQEYWILQVCKLHDNEKTCGKENLVIGTILKIFQNNESIHTTLKDKKEKLDQFYDHLKDARNKIISHHDCQTRLDKKTLGSFDEGEDVVYFQELQDFINICFEQYGDSPKPLNDLVRNDIDVFLRQFNSGDYRQHLM